MSSAERKSWWDRNWFWAIPSGCLGCFGLVVGSCALMIGGILGTIRSSTPFQESLERARSDPRVIEALGTPIRSSWTVSGRFSLEQEDSFVDITIPLSGPKGEAELHVVARKHSDEWQYEKMSLWFDDADETIDLLEPPSPTAPRAQT